jgi:dihydrofolate reductase
VRKLILFIAASLDGYIAGPNGEIDWLLHDHDYGYTAFYAGIDTVIMGRKTYELALRFGEYPYPGTSAYVFSRAPRAPDAHARFVGGDVAGFVGELKSEPGRDIWLVGGGEIVRECLGADLIDEFVVSIHPLVLGAGVPLFPPGVPRRALRLAGVARYPSGLVQLTYARGA